jgi:hypothetical protein
MGNTPPHEMRRGLEQAIHQVCKSSSNEINNVIIFTSLSADESSQPKSHTVTPSEVRRHKYETCRQGLATALMTQYSALSARVRDQLEFGAR